MILVQPKRNLIGKKFNLLTVVERTDDYVSPKNGDREPRYLCDCDCGNKNVIARQSQLVHGSKKSCGCIKSKAISESLRKTNNYNLNNKYGIGYVLNGEEFYFDLEDYDKIKDYYWLKNQDGYIYTNIPKGNGKKIYMHRFIINPEGCLIDHINNNKSDNRKQNLRRVSYSQNMMNQSLRKNNTSGVAGVRWDNIKNKWIAYITKNSKRRNLGYFDEFDDAVKRRKQAEEIDFGEYSYDNSQKQASVIKD